jgi:DNA-binding NtrC family response regulator
MSGRVLVVDDDHAMGELAREALGSRGNEVECRASALEALCLFEHADFDVVVTDLHLQGMSGLDLCEQLLTRRADSCVVVMTAFGSIEGAIGAMRAGAHDFVVKPLSMDALGVAIERAIQHRRLRAELKRLRKHVDSAELPHVVGDSSTMKQMSELISRVALSDVSVCITGESGTGKELVAKAIHDRSGRKGPFLAINCAAVAETLLESELFGHSRGAFTDAHATRKGLFVEADGGTLFLDEIGDMGLGMQAKILRALQERTVRPVGESTESPFDARIITATNRDLEADVSDKRFRADLYYRINVVRVDVPPLRARGNDALLLAQHFLARSAGPAIGFGSAVAEKLLAYDWPGNVRELENCIERAIALAAYDEITIDDLPSKIRDQIDAGAPPPADDPIELPTLRAIEDRYIRQVLASADGNKTLAAKILGFDRRTLYRKLASAAASNA